MKKIQSESTHIIHIILSLIMIPINVILFILKKRKISDITKPLHLITAFITEAKATLILILINIIIFATVGSLFVIGMISEQFISRFFLDSADKMFSGNLIPMVLSWFFHLSFAHLFYNMVMLLILGRVVEKELGSIKFLYIYLGAALIASLTTNLAHLYLYNNPAQLGAGASGAITGLAAAAMLLTPFSLTYLVLGIPIPIFIIVWFQLASDVLGIVNPTASNIGHFAHLGGFLSITILGIFLSKNDQARIKAGLIVNIITLVVFGILWYEI